MKKSIRVSNSTQPEQINKKQKNKQGIRRKINLGQYPAGFNRPAVQQLEASERTPLRHTEIPYPGFASRDVIYLFEIESED